MNEVLKNQFFRGIVHSVVSDKQCQALEKAKAHGVHIKTFFENDEEEFSTRLLDHLVKNSVDYVFSFYTGFFGSHLRHVYKDRIINLHPSLLPAFKGMVAFDDAVAYGAKFVGSTMEFVDERMDEGKIIMQTICPLDTNQQPAVTRHKIFVQQCKALLQVAKWLVDQRITVAGRCVTVRDAKFTDTEFSPNLDFEDAINLQVPHTK